VKVDSPLLWWRLWEIAEFETPKPATTDMQDDDGSNAIKNTASADITVVEVFDTGQCKNSMVY